MENCDEKIQRSDETYGVEIGKEMCVRSAELENGAIVNVLSPVTTLEALTRPNLIALKCLDLGFDFVAGIGPKVLENGRKICGDDVYLLWSEISWSAGKAAVVMVDQFDGLSSGSQEVFNGWLKRALDDPYRKLRLKHYKRFCEPACEVLSGLAEAAGREGVSVDADLLAVIVQRTFYDPQKAETRLVPWMSALNAGLARILQETPPAFREYLIKDYLTTMVEEFLRVRALYGYRLKASFEDMVTIQGFILPARFKNNWADSIFTTGLYVMYSDHTSQEGTTVVGNFTRSLADSVIAWVYRQEGQKGQQELMDVLNVDSNRSLDRIFFTRTDLGNRNRFYTDYIYPFVKVGGVFATRDSLSKHALLESPSFLVPSSATLALCQTDSRVWRVGNGRFLDVYHMSDGAYCDSRDPKRPAIGGSEILTVAKKFGLDPSGYLGGKYLSGPPDDLVVARLSFR